MRNILGGLEKKSWPKILVVFAIGKILEFIDFFKNLNNPKKIQ